MVACGTVSVSGIQNSVDCTGISDAFTADVVPIFDSRTCTTSGCHIGSSPAGGLDLDAAGDVNEIYQNILDSGAVDPATDPDDPLNASLGAKPLKGLTSHEGGDIFTSLSDNDYEKIYCWIESGAANN